MSENFHRSSTSTPRSLVWQRRLTLLTILLTAVVIMLGAWTRLSDAGLGCPDWPGCYGHMDVRKAIDYVSTKNELQPGTYREAHKTVPEMVHRYFASLLGLMIIIIAALAWANRRQPEQPVALPLALVALVIFQGILGKWTVTMGLQPTIVMLHLLGGFSTFTLLCWLAAQLYGWPQFRNDPDVRSLKPLGTAALAIVIMQIALGGWTTANYAAVVCTELPICEKGWVSHINFADAFTFFGHDHDGEDYEFGVLENDARTTIHVMHRFGALATLLVVGLLAIQVARRARCTLNRNLGLTMGVVVAAQFALGVSNVVFHVPLDVAVAHNFGAVILLVSIVLFLRAISVQPERRQGNV